MDDGTGSGGDGVGDGKLPKANGANGSTGEDPGEMTLPDCEILLARGVFYACSCAG
jgi:hypothetical protein